MVVGGRGLIDTATGVGAIVVIGWNQTATPSAAAMVRLNAVISAKTAAPTRRRRAPSSGASVRRAWLACSDPRLLSLPSCEATFCRGERGSST